jgi:hypothetical protein
MRGRTGRHSGIMSAFRGLRSSAGRRTGSVAHDPLRKWRVHRSSRDGDVPVPYQRKARGRLRINWSELRRAPLITENAEPSKGTCSTPDWLIF